MIAVAAPVGLLAAAVTWRLSERAAVTLRSERLPLPDPNLGVAGAAVLLAIALLLGAALLAGRWSVRAATRGEDTRGGQG
jgi:hypothetical protein